KHFHVGKASTLRLRRTLGALPSAILPWYRLASGQERSSMCRRSFQIRTSRRPRLDKSSPPRENLDWRLSCRAHNGLLQGRLGQALFIVALTPGTEEAACSPEPRMHRARATSPSSHRGESAASPHH